MTTTSRASSTQLAVDDLAVIRGKIITRSDPEYDAARAVYNGAVDRYPLAIVRCADVADGVFTGIDPEPRESSGGEELGGAVLAGAASTSAGGDT